MRLLLVTLLLTLTAQPSLANTATPGNLLGGNGGGSGSCSWDQFLEQLGCQETGFVCGGGQCPKSCDKQYTTISPRADDPSWGKWQFTPDTWRRYTGEKYPQCQGMANAISVECRPAQKWATIQMMESAKEFFKKNNWCGAKLGQTVTGTHQGTTKTCTINKSGLLSAYHNAGGNACTFAGGTSKWSSQINWRICDAADIPFPEECDPQTQPPTIPDTVTPGEPNFVNPSLGFERPTHFNALGDSLKYIWVAAFQLMTEQLVTNMMHQAKIIGTFFDAKHQLETQRLMQQRHAEAHKDYHPSEQMCTIGTAVRDLADTDKRAELTKTAITNTILDRALATGDVETMRPESDQDTRREEFIKKFCNKKDNTEDNDELCGDGVDKERINADINFTQTIDAPLTIDLDLLNETKPEEENIFTLLDYIFMHESFPWLSTSRSLRSNFIQPYQDMRSVIAIRSVAQNSFAEIIALKTQGPEQNDETTPAAPFIKSLMQEMGISPDDIEKELGERPSYYAQMEILTKKIYQHPEFVSNLYDKPANVKRIIAAMTAIKVMQDRDIHKALMRREMLMSMLLEIQLRYEQQDLENREIRKVLSQKIDQRPARSGGGGSGGGGF